MPQYQEYSFKELRVQDYEASRNRAPAVGRLCISAIITEIRQDHKNAEVQMLGFRALLRCAQDHANNMVAIAQDGGVSFVIAGLFQHPMHPGVQLCGCGVLASLATGNTDDNKIAIAQQGGITAVIEGAGRQDVVSLASGNNKVAMVKAGVKHLIQKASNVSSDNKIGCQVLLDQLIAPADPA